MSGLLAIGASVLGGLFGSSKQSKAAKAAAEAQARAAQAALDFEKQQYEEQKRFATPGILGGAQATAQQMNMLGLNGQGYLNNQYGAFGQTAPTLGAFDLTSQPGYQFRLNEGQRALERSAAARGGLFSGGTGRQLTRYGQDYASGEFNNAFNQFGALAGNGQSLNSSVMGAAGNLGAAGANLITQAGNARASGYTGAAEPWANFWGNTVPGAFGALQGSGATKKWF